MARNSDKLGPYSRRLNRGALGNISGRSREGRFIRALERDLLELLGPDPTLPSRLLVSRIARASLRIEMLEEKIADGLATELDGKILHNLHGSLRLMLREIGQGDRVMGKPMTLAEARANAVEATRLRRLAAEAEDAA
jgi:hypothetical protein